MQNQNDACDIAQPDCGLECANYDCYNFDHQCNVGTNNECHIQCDGQQSCLKTKLTTTAEMFVSFSRQETCKQVTLTANGDMIVICDRYRADLSMLGC